MEISTLQNQSESLLTGKNVLNESVVDKYRLAGQISQTTLAYVVSLIHDSYHYRKISPLKPSEICILGDSFMEKTLKTAYLNVAEKGIAHPVSLDVNDVSNGASPEIAASYSQQLNEYFKEGDLVKVTLGCHVDGYTAVVSHTVVIYPVEDSKPAGPVLGAKADVICASYIATEAVVALLGCVLSPEKIPGGFSSVSGSMVRAVVDKVAENFGCMVVPGSKIRRIRRFLAGQAENIVAERDFKGVVWSEAHQEVSLLQKSSKIDSANELILANGVKNDPNNAIPTDDFTFIEGEVYNIDIKMASISEIEVPGLVTLENSDEFSGKNHRDGGINANSDVFIRDFAIQYNLKMKTSRHLLNKVEKISSVYPFKLSHFTDNFPLSGDSIDDKRAQIAEAAKQINKLRLGLGECVNNHLIVQKKVQLVRFLPLQAILVSSNQNARTSTDSDLTLEHTSLPGHETPLPKLGITHLKLKSLLKKSSALDCARESCTIVLNKERKELLRLTGGTKIFPACWAHSAFKLQDDTVMELIKMGQDKRWGVRVKECQPMKRRE